MIIVRSAILAGATVLLPCISITPAQGALLERVFFSTPSQSGGGNDICSMRPDGTDVQNLGGDTTLGMSNPSISPDGSRIAYSGYDGTNYTLWTMNPNGSNKTVVHSAANPHDIRWYDNSTIAYSARTGAPYDMEIRSVKVDGTNDVSLVSIPMLGQSQLVFFDFSPDRSRLVMDAQPHGFSSPNCDLYMADVLPGPTTTNHQPFYADAGDDQMDRYPLFGQGGDSVFWMHDTLPGVETPKALVRKATNGSSPVTDYDEVIRPAGANGLYMWSLWAKSPDDDTRFLMTDQDGRMYLWNSMTQTDTLLWGSYPSGAADWGYVVPEPSTLCLLTLGGLAIIRRKR